MYENRSFLYMFLGILKFQLNNDIGILFRKEFYMENNISIIDEVSLIDKIYIVRGKQVMLDCDLAEIYGYKVKVLNQQVKRNIERFPEDFIFQLTKTELENILS